MPDQLRGCKVLVSGAGGFIGAHLVAALVRQGAHVRALVHYNGRNDWGQLEALPTATRAAIEVTLGDVRDPFFVADLVRRSEIVFHLAALAPIPYSYIAPAQFVETNVRGTLNMLEAARRHQVRRLVHTSSSEVYGSAQYTPIDERHPLRPQSPYAASKVGADALASAYWSSFQTPIVTVRPFNTFGPRQSARAFIPSVVSQALSTGVVRVGSLDPVRDMNYVDDIIAGFLRAATVANIEGLTVNLGSGRGMTMQDLLQRLLRIIGRDVRIEREVPRMRPDSSEVRALVCNPALAADQLGWRTAIDLDTGLQRTAEWIAAHLDEYKPNHLAL